MVFDLFEELEKMFILDACIKSFHVKNILPLGLITTDYKFRLRSTSNFQLTFKVVSNTGLKYWSITTKISRLRLAAIAIGIFMH